MGKSFSRELAEWMAKVDKQLSNLSSGNRLDHASLDGTTLYLRDADGNLSGRLGRQPDGSNGVHVVRVQPPPQLTAAILTVGEQAGTCLVEWDGGTFDGRRMPLIHGHTEIWAELVGDEWEPTVAPGESAKRVGTIRDRTGGEVVVALPQAGVWAVWLRAMGADRETAGPWSPVATVEVTPLVDTEAIEAELALARDRISQAEEELADGMTERAAEIAYLREERIPELQAALNTGLTDVYEQAEARAEQLAGEAVNQAAADAQTEYDRLQELAERALSRAGDNMVEDPGFETSHWIDEWDGLGGRVVRWSSPRTGNNSVAIEPGNTVELPLLEFNVETDQSYRFQVWGRTSSGNIADFGPHSRLRLIDADTGGTVAEAEPFTAATSYTRAVVTYQVPSGVSSLQAVVAVDHSEGLLLLDDISVQEVGAAAEALRLAEVARQEAEAAHVTAGLAADQAALAYDAVAGKNTIHWSLSAPSGTGADGDVWWRYEMHGGRRAVIGSWHYEDGIWEADELAEEYLPLVNIGSGTYGMMAGDRLEANSVETRHLYVGNSENLWPEVWHRSGAAGVYTYNGGSSNAGNATAISRFVSESPPVSSSWQPVTLNGRRGWRTQGDASSQSLAFRTGPGRGIPVTAGEKYALQTLVRDTADNSPLSWLIQFFSEDGTQGSSGSSQYAALDLRGELHAAEDTDGVTHTFEVPDLGYTGTMFMVPFLRHEQGTGTAGRTVMEPKLRKMVTGGVIVDGAIKSRTVDTEEFFSAVAVIEKIWTDIVRSRLIESEGIITEDMIATGAITTPKLTVTEEMVAQIASFIRVEAGSLASNDIEAMRIVSSLIESSVIEGRDANGELTYRLDGMDNLVTGRLQAGMDHSEGITLDWGQKVRFSGLNEEGEPDPQRTIDTPYLNFRTDDVDYQEHQEPSIHLDRMDPSGRNGMMIINPGYPVGTDAFRGKLNVVGDVQANRVEARERATARQGFEVPHDDSNLVTLLYRESWSDNTYLLGRHHGASQSRARDSFWVSDQYELLAGARRRRFFTWGTPPPTGERSPILSVRLTEAASDRNAYVVVNSSHHTNTGYAINEYNPSSARATYYVYQLAIWEGA